MMAEEKRIAERQEWLKNLSESDRTFIARYGEDKWRKFKEVQESLQKPNADLKERLSTLIDIGSETAGDLVKQYEILVDIVSKIDLMKTQIGEELDRLIQINDEMQRWLDSVKVAHKRKELEIEIQPNPDDPDNPKYFLHRPKK
jgi:hypothetical protein